jgi:hypothetical protein
MIGKDRRGDLSVRESDSRPVKCWYRVARSVEPEQVDCCYLGRPASRRRSSGLLTYNDDLDWEVNNDLFQMEVFVEVGHTLRREGAADG